MGSTTLRSTEISLTAILLSIRVQSTLGLPWYSARLIPKPPKFTVPYLDPTGNKHCSDDAFISGLPVSCRLLVVPECVCTQVAYIVDIMLNKPLKQSNSYPQSVLNKIK